MAFFSAIMIPVCWLPLKCCQCEKSVGAAEVFLSFLVGTCQTARMGWS